MGKKIMFILWDSICVHRWKSSSKYSLHYHHVFVHASTPPYLHTSYTTVSTVRVFEFYFVRKIISTPALNDDKFTVNLKSMSYSCFVVRREHKFGLFFRFVYLRNGNRRTARVHDLTVNAGTCYYACLDGERKTTIFLFASEITKIECKHIQVTLHELFIKFYSAD